MSEMIERVAKAIYEEDDPWHKAWPWPNLNESQGSPEPYRRIAAAAIRAMRDPSDAILDVMHDRIQILVDPAKRTADIQNNRDLWQAMIDAALVGEE